MASYGVVCVIVITYFNIFYNVSAYKVLNNTYEAKKGQCQEKTCVPKCCPEGYVVMGHKTCIYSNKSLDFSDLQLFDVDVTKVVFKKELIIIPAMFNNETFKESALQLSRFDPFNLYVTEAGFLYLEEPNAYNRWIKKDASQFCVDYLVKQDGVPTIKIWVFIDDIQGDLSGNISFYEKIITCVFLLLVLIMYPLVPSNRDLNGIMLLLSVANLFLAFSLLLVLSFFEMNKTGCLKFTFNIQVLYLSSFCWISLMAFNTWQTFRNFVLDRSMYHNNDVIKMLKYCAFALGLPLVLTVAMTVVNTLDLRHIPWFIKPMVPAHGCFIEGGEKVLYLFLPTLILLLASVVFDLMTARYIVGLKRWMAQRAFTASHEVEFRTNYQRFKVQVAMVTVFIIHCLTEMVSALTPSRNTTCHMSDIYGILWGPLLFFILIVYYHILRKRLPVSSNKHPSQFQNISLYGLSKANNVTSKTSLSE